MALEGCSLLHLLASSAPENYLTYDGSLADLVRQMVAAGASPNSEHGKLHSVARLFDDPFEANGTPWGGKWGAAAAPWVRMALAAQRDVIALWLGRQQQRRQQQQCQMARGCPGGRREASAPRQALTGRRLPATPG